MIKYRDEYKIGTNNQKGLDKKKYQNMSSRGKNHG